MFMKNKGVKGYVPTISICCIIVAITLIGIIYLQDGEKRIKTQYSSQVKGIQSLKGQANNFIPLKVNLAGVMPIIFTSSLFQMYILVITLLKIDTTNIFYKVSKFLSSSNWFKLDSPIYTIGFILYCILYAVF